MNSSDDLDYDVDEDHYDREGRTHSPDALMTIDLSGLPARRLRPTHETPEVTQTVDDNVVGVRGVTIQGEAWTERMTGSREVEIRIAEGTPWIGEDYNPTRTYRATFGEGGHYRDLEDVRQTLREIVWLNREEQEQADRILRWNAENAVLDVIERDPGITSRSLVERVRALVGGRDDDVRHLRNDLLEAGAITTIDGPRRAVYHHLGDEAVVAGIRANRNADPEAVLL